MTRPANIRDEWPWEPREDETEEDARGRWLQTRAKARGDTQIRCEVCDGLLHRCGKYCPYCGEPLRVGMRSQVTKPIRFAEVCKDG